MNKLFPNIQFIDAPRNDPQVCIVVDTEEDFDWNPPFSRTHYNVREMSSLPFFNSLVSSYGVAPAYMVTYPIVSDPEAVRVLRRLRDKYDVCIGAQLHPWVTPPFDESLDDRNSYAGNLPASLEAAKISSITQAIQDKLGVRPIVYRAGRYGFGPNTARILEEFGYEIDTSLAPCSDYADQGGPDFLDWRYKPFWFGNAKRILELPLTRDYVGPLSFSGTGLLRVFSRRSLGHVSLMGIFSRMQLLERVTLSPEGNSCGMMRALARQLVRRDAGLLSISFHSSSLALGQNPYVRTKADLHGFYDRLSCFLDWFKYSLGGRFASPVQWAKDLSTAPIR